MELGPLKQHQHLSRWLLLILGPPLLPFPACTRYLGVEQPQYAGRGKDHRGEEKGERAKC